MPCYNLFYYQKWKFAIATTILLNKHSVAKKYMFGIFDLQLHTLMCLPQVATDECNSRNEMWHWTNDEIGVAIQSWLWVQVELMAW